MAGSARTQPRKVPRQTRAKATLDSIVEAAARFLRSDGYEGANVNRIAELAGVSVGSLYQYFPSKEALVAAVMARHNARMIETFERGLPELAHLPLPLAVRGIVERTLAAHAEDRELHRVIVEQVPRTGLLVRTDEFQVRLRQMCAGYLEFHRDEVRPRDLDLAVRVLIVAVEAVVSELSCDRAASLDDPAVVGEIAALVLGYVQAR